MTMKGLMLSLVVLTFGVQSCTKAVIDEVDKDTLEPLTEIITYQTNIKSIISDNCIACHAAPVPNAGLDLTTYQNVRNAAENGNLVERVNSPTNPMPPNGNLAPELLQMIDKWVEDGYPE